MEANLITNFIQQYGYFALFFALFLESICIPIPSELVLCFSGYLIYKGHFSFLPTLLIAWSGSFCGAFCIYSVSKNTGRNLVYRFGHFIKITPNLIQKTEKWFLKFGPLLIIPWRQIPLIKSKISVIAGVLNMKTKTFAFFTSIATGFSTCLMVFLGYHLGNRWLNIINFFQYFSKIIFYIILLILVSTIIFLLFFKKRQSK